MIWYISETLEVRDFIGEIECLYVLGSVSHGGTKCARGLLTSVSVKCCSCAAKGMDTHTMTTRCGDCFCMNNVICTMLCTRTGSLYTHDATTGPPIIRVGYYSAIPFPSFCLLSRDAPMTADQRYLSCCLLS